MGASQTVSLLISAASGLAGAVIGGVVAYCTLRQQLGHASTEARLAREHALKREVYLSAAEGLARNVQYLVGIAQLDLTLQQLHEIPKADPGWAYRVNIIADLDTIKALDEASEFLFLHLLDLMAKRVDVDSIRRTAETLHERIDQLSAYTQQLVAVLGAISGPDATPEARAQVPQMTREFVDAHEQLTDLAEDWRRASQRQQQAHRGLFEATMKAVADLQLLLAQVNVRIRRELGLPLDEDGYLAHVRQSSDRVLVRLKEAMDRFEGQ